MLVMVLAVNLPRKVNVEGWGVLLGGVASLEWVVIAGNCWLRRGKGTEFLGKVLNRDQTVPCWPVWVVMPV